jgi:dephospho-CoA kinase
MKVVVINGKAGVGKDTFVNIFSKNYNHRVKNFSSIDRVKKIAELCFGWNGIKTAKSRRLLSNLKKTWSDFNNGPIKDIVSRIKKDITYCNSVGIDTTDNVYFVHIREPHEIKKLKRYFNNVITLLIERDTEEFDNYSDRNVDKFEYDYVINNNSDINNLKIEVNEFINYLINRDNSIFIKPIKRNSKGSNYTIYDIDNDQHYDKK